MSHRVSVASLLFLIATLTLISPASAAGTTSWNGPTHGYGAAGSTIRANVVRVAWTPPADKPSRPTTTGLRLATSRSGQFLAAEGGGALLRAGAGAGEGLPVSMRTVATVAEKYGIGLEGVDVSIAGPSRIALGETGPSGEILLYHPAFSSEEELAKTLMEERLHSWQVQTYGYNFLTHPAVNPYVEMETKAGVDAWFAAMTGGQ